MTNDCRAHVKPEPIEASEPQPRTLIGRDVHEIERRARTKAWQTAAYDDGHGFHAISLGTSNLIIDTYLQSVRDQERGR